MTKLTVSTIVNAPVQQVWDARTQPEDIMQWNFASDDWCCPVASVDLKIWGMMNARMEAKDGSFGFDYLVQYEEIEPMKKLVYIMGEFKEHFVPAWRKVEVLFESLTEDQIKVTEIFDAEEVHSLEQQIEGWQAILENFKKHVEKVSPKG